MTEVIVGRLDRLGEDARQVAALAAVIGQEFDFALVHRAIGLPDAVVAKAVEELVRRRILRAAGDRLDFAHDRIRDVAYQAILAPHRRILHGRIVRALEEVYAGRLERHCTALAVHAREAEAWDKALTYFQHSAAQATARSALRDVLALYEQALDAASAVASVARSPAPRARSRSRAACRRESPHSAMAQWSSDFARWIAMSAPSGLHVMGYIRAVTARLDEAGQHLARALAISRATGDPVRQSLVLQIEAVRRNWLGDYQASRELAAEGLRIARERELVMPLLRNLWTHGVALVGAGAYDEARATLEEGMSLAEKVGDTAYIPRYVNTLGWLHLECGDFDRGQALSGVALEWARKNWTRAGIEQTAFTELNRGDAFLARGEIALAREAFSRTARIVGDPATSEWMKWRYTIHCHVSLGELALAREEPDEARGFAERALEAAMRTGSRKYIVRASRLAGEAARLRGRWTDAERDLARALAMAHALGNPRELWQSHRAAARFHDARRHADAAAAAAHAAARVVAEMKARVRDPGLRAGLNTWR